ILSWSFDGTARIWDAKTGGEITTFHHAESVYGATWSKDENRVLTWSLDGTATIWDTKNGEILVLLLHEGPVDSATWNADETQVMTIDSWKAMRVWDVSNGKVLVEVKSDSPAWRLYRAAWSHDYRNIVVWFSDGRILGIESSTGKTIFEFRHDNEVRSVRWSQDDSTLLSISADYTVRLWNIANEHSPIILRHENGVNGARWNTDETLVLTWTTDSLINVWDARDGTLLHTFSHEIGEINGAIWNNDETQIMSWGNDRTLRIWDIGTATELIRLSKIIITDAIWKSDGEAFLLWYGGELSLRNSENGEEILSLNHGEFVTGALWDERDNLILSWGTDGTIKLWILP
ncbi:partial putative serine/threonine-protein kinase PkwA, partial [Anaerolineae bacterium]